MLSSSISMELDLVQDTCMHKNVSNVSARFSYPRKTGLMGI